MIGRWLGQWPVVRADQSGGATTAEATERRLELSDLTLGQPALEAVGQANAVPVVEALL